MNSRAFAVYMLASRRNGTLYVGMTSDLVGRVYQHKTKATPGFTAQYDVVRLVWFELYDDAYTAVTRERELKKWRRAWKLALIEKENGAWNDLYPMIAGPDWIPGSSLRSTPE